MARYYPDKKDRVEESRDVSIAWLREQGYFDDCPTGTITWTNRWSKQTYSIGVTVCTTDQEPYVRFQYTNTRRSTGQITECDYKAQLVTTPCHFGGVRWWFICPLGVDGVPCGRRVGKLYCPLGAMYYGCRHCHNLSYDSQNESLNGRINVLGKLIKLSREHKNVLQQTKRLFYAGRPTRKLRRLAALKAEMDRYLPAAGIDGYGGAKQRPY